MWKKIRKNKRPWKWPKPFYSVHQFLKDSEICFRTKWEIRKIFMEEIDKKYQKWLEIETKKWNMTMHIKSLMYELEKMLEKNNELRISINSDELKPFLNNYFPDFDIPSDLSDEELMNIIIFEKKITPFQIINFQQREG